MTALVGVSQGAKAAMSAGTLARPLPLVKHTRAVCVDVDLSQACGHARHSPRQRALCLLPKARATLWLDLLQSIQRRALNPAGANGTTLARID